MLLGKDYEDRFLIFRYIPALPKEAFFDSDNSGSLSLKCLEKIGFDEKVGAQPIFFPIS